MNEMFQDTRVNELWLRWGEYTGLNTVAQQFALVADRLAEAAGIVGRGRLWEIYETGSEQATATIDNCFDAEQVETAISARDDFLKCMSQLPLHANRITDETTIFVRDTLQLPWPWLVLELIEGFVKGVAGLALGQVQRTESWAEYEEPLTPDVKLQFETLPGETVSKAFERLCESFGEAMNELLQPYEEHFLPRGRVPTDEEDELRGGVGKYARWFYRNRLCGESIRHISQTDRFDRSTVKRGIVEAERLLGLTQWVF